MRSEMGPLTAHATCTTSGARGLAQSRPICVQVAELQAREAAAMERESMVAEREEGVAEREAAVAGREAQAREAQGRSRALA